MDPFDDMNWFAIHAKRRREMFAATNVGELGVDVFFPKALVERPRRGTLDHIVEPLFPGYFFARFRPLLSLGLVMCCPGVLQVVSSGKCPIPVEESVIREIQDRLEAGVVRIGHRSLKPGDRICIDAGPFEGMMGRVEQELADQRRVAILLEAMWNARVLIEKQWVQAEAA